MRTKKAKLATQFKHKGLLWMKFWKISWTKTAFFHSFCHKNYVNFENIYLSIPNAPKLNHFRLPFDWSNPIGYSFAMALQYVFIFNAAFTSICFVAFAIGTSLLLMTLTEDLKCDLNSLDKSIKLKENRVEIFKRFCQFVQFHSDAKQLS